ncbi:MAG: CBS domain-containing protein [Ardenticatenaceae bacterium]|nr:CBS domain-containing protein [Ardenticatenaceae bacterium]
MLVRERMSRHLITATPEMTYPTALRLMRDNTIRRLPVLDQHNRLIGIVVEKDLLYASPSPATSLSIHEIHGLLANLKMRDIMTTPVVTVGPECPLEEAARIMIDRKIGSLPVLEGDSLVGLITETDIFRIFAEALGAREAGLRATVVVPEGRGVLARVGGAIAAGGASILSLATFLGPDAQHRELTLRVRGTTADRLQSALESSGAEIIDLRDVQESYQPRLVG